MQQIDPISLSSFKEKKKKAELQIYLRNDR